jgi:hypothetical protein
MKRGAWREHPAETRAALVKRAFAAGGTVVLGGVAIAGLPRSAISAPSPEQDVEILNLALLLEYLESAFFAEASVRGGLSGELLEFADVVRGHERAHVAFLRRVLSCCGALAAAAAGVGGRGPRAEAAPRRPDVDVGDRRAFRDSAESPGSARRWRCSVPVPATGRPRSFSCSDVRAIVGVFGSASGCPCFRTGRRAGCRDSPIRATACYEPGW